ncbi:hypothetical protein AWM70_20660 [Paenibacillus yonginensis]|uniref:Uncharacterized protein n=1 Tax=Paenibacillus yonginensis TaxID=1462996 RepID=A0A1B1N5I7_9BACL|nr:hypothetical protein [Paenibacillus yonginensis]ANS76693.1 hypothetical protein AWM70_20660 [Paenibacillus yonginensis]
MIYGFIILVILGILFLIIFNVRNSRRNSGTSGAGEASGGIAGADSPAAGSADSPAEEAALAPEAVVPAEPGLNPDSFDPASLDNAAAVGAIEVDHPPVTSAGADLKAARQGSLDAQYRDALRRFAAEEGGEGRQSGDDPLVQNIKSADEAYRDALRAMRRKE